MEAMPPPGRLAAAGALAALVALATSVLLDGFGRGVPSLVLSVGQAVIRWSPGSAARQGVDTFGTADKPLLVAGVVLVVVVAGAATGPGRAAFAAPTGVLGLVGEAVFFAHGRSIFGFPIREEAPAARIAMANEFGIIGRAYHSRRARFTNFIVR